MPAPCGIAGGSVDLLGADASEMAATLDALRQAGVHVEEHKGNAVSADGPLGPLTLSTAPYPGFATDMQAQFMAMLLQGRWRQRADRNHLRKPLHARSRTEPDGRAYRNQGPHRRGPRRGPADRCPGHGDRFARFDEPDHCRACRRRRDQVNRVYHLDRGYERLEEKLQAVGADIERVVILLPS
jgi:UDP-N-acetylglucosamine 1-carboxyvinyltransferase